MDNQISAQTKLLELQNFLRQYSTVADSMVLDETLEQIRSLECEIAFEEMVRDFESQEDYWLVFESS